MYTVVYGVNISTRISTNSMTPTPSSSIRNDFTSLTRYALSIYFFSFLPIFQIPNARNAGTETITIIIINIKNNGSISFVDASSPRRLASAFSSSNADSISVSSAFRSPSAPFLTFCSKSPESFRYGLRRQPAPNSAYACSSETPRCIR